MTDLLPTADDPARVIVGDALDVLRRLPDGCVHCCVTSPPYWGLRDYGTGTWEGGDAGCDHRQVRGGNGAASAKQTTSGGTQGYQYAGTCPHCGAVRIDRQIGLEPTPDQFVARLVEVFAEVRRVLHPSGVLFVNMGDSYASGEVGRKDNGRLERDQEKWSQPMDGQSGRSHRRIKQRTGLKPKDLVGVPWRLAFALQAAGWWLRSDIPWVKRAAMPESVTDRPAKALEYVFLLTKKDRYYFDMEAVKKSGSPSSASRYDYAFGTSDKGKVQRTLSGTPIGQREYDGNRNFRNADLWFQSIDAPHGLVGIGDELVGLDVTSDPYPEAHFATFPPALVEPMIKAGSSEKGVCPACYAPWVRVTERKKLKRERPNDLTKRTGENGTGNHCPNTVAGVAVQTLGWEASCECGLAAAPSIILDPFAGSGTTLAVAVKLKRRALGIELNPEYAKLAEKRLAEPLGTGGLYDTGKPVVADLFDHLTPGPDDVEADGVSVG